jgi:mitochondrial fission protein ELM1
MHGFSPARLASLRAQLAPSILDLPQPRVAVVLGGRNKAYRYGPADHERLAAALGAVAASGASFLVTPSRRTHADLLAAALAATAGRPRLIQTGAGENLYPQVLAAADRLIVTGDSVSMTSEALATGRPVDVFVPEGRGGKFARFHQAVFSAGLARPLDTLSQSDADWTPRAVDATETVARHVERQWLLARLPQPHG